MCCAAQRRLEESRRPNPDHPSHAKSTTVCLSPPTTPKRQARLQIASQPFDDLRGHIINKNCPGKGVPQKLLSCSEFCTPHPEQVSSPHLDRLNLVLPVLATAITSRPCKEVKGTTPHTTGKGRGKAPGMPGIGIEEQIKERQQTSTRKKS